MLATLPAPPHLLSWTSFPDIVLPSELPLPPCHPSSYHLSTPWPCLRVSMGGRWGWKIEGTGEGGCRMVCGGGEVRGWGVVQVYVYSGGGQGLAR